MLQWPYELELFVTQPRQSQRQTKFLDPERLLKNKMESNIIYTSMCHECFFESGPVLFSKLSFLLVRKRQNHSKTIMCLCVCICWVVLSIGLCLMLRMCVFSLHFLVYSSMVLDVADFVCSDVVDVFCLFMNYF